MVKLVKIYGFSVCYTTEGTVQGPWTMEGTLIACGCRELISAFSSAVASSTSLHFIHFIKARAGQRTPAALSDSYTGPY